MRLRSELLTLALLSTPAMAAAHPRYMFIDANRNGLDGYFLDVNSMRVEGNRRDVWFLDVELAPTGQQYDISHTFKHYTYDCANGTSQMTYGAVFAINGDSIMRGATGASAEPVVPNTVGAHIQEVVCRSTPAYPSDAQTIPQARAFARQKVEQQRERDNGR